MGNISAQGLVKAEAGAKSGFCATSDLHFYAVHSPAAISLQFRGKFYTFYRLQSCLRFFIKAEEA